MIDTRPSRTLRSLMSVPPGTAARTDARAPFVI